jgi:hypothetical protein
LTGVFYEFKVRLSTLGERHENFNNDSIINSILGLCMALLTNYGQVSRCNMNKYLWLFLFIFWGYIIWRMV